MPRSNHHEPRNQLYLVEFALQADDCAVEGVEVTRKPVLVAREASGGLDQRQ